LIRTRRPASVKPWRQSDILRTLCVGLWACRRLPCVMGSFTGQALGSQRTARLSHSCLPALADAVGAKPLYRVPVWLGRLMIGDGGVSMITRVRGCSNAKAKCELGRQPIYSSWRRGFIEGIG